MHEALPRPSHAQRIAAALGPDSPACRQSLASLAPLFDALSGSPALRVRFAFWQQATAADAGAPNGRDAFLRHTYLAAVARLIAYISLRPARVPSDADIEGILRGDYFEARHGLPYFAEEDCFVWPIPAASSETTEARAEGIGWLRRLLQSLQTEGLADTDADDMAALYASFVGGVPRDLEAAHAERALVAFLLDPRCGSGARLAAAIQSQRESLTKEGCEPPEVLLRIVESVRGQDTRPLAVAVARTSYLLALGDLLDIPRGDLVVPVFLVGASHPPKPATAPGDVPVYAMEIGDRPAQVYVPRSLAEDPIGLDYLLPFMKGKYAKAVLNAQNETMLGRAWYSFHNFLVTPMTSRKLFALTEPEAEVMIQSQHALVELMRQGQDSFWYSVLRNTARAMGAETRSLT